MLLQVFAERLHLIGIKADFTRIKLQVCRDDQIVRFPDSQRVYSTQTVLAFRSFIMTSSARLILAR